MNPDDRPELKVPDRFGVYLRWPQDGNDWIHPEDVELTNQLIPGRRIFQRHALDGDYSKYTYGEHSIRLKPTLWLEVESDGYLVGDRVEIRSQMGKRDPSIATIEDVLWNQHEQFVEYTLVVNGTTLPTSFRFAEIQPVFKLGQPMSLRESELAAKARLN